MTLTHQNYHDHPALSANEIGTFIDDPVLWWHVYKVKDWPRPEPTDAMEDGTLIHLCLQYGGWENIPNIAVKPYGLNLATKEGKALKAENETKQIIDSKQAVMLSRIWSNFKANRLLEYHLETGDKEQAIFWDDELLGPCRCKPDLLHLGLLFDWKSTTAKTERDFVNEIVRRNYDTKLALYRRGTKADRVVIVGIQKTGSCFLIPVELDEDWLNEAEGKLFETYRKMLDFDLAAHLNKKPSLVSCPKWGMVEIED